jgi:hypothetical protein
MIDRVCAAVCVAVCGLMLTSGETAARSAGFGARSVPAAWHAAAFRRFAQVAPRRGERRRADYGYGFGYPLVVPGGAFTYGVPYDPADFGAPAFVEPEIVTGAIPAPGYLGDFIGLVRRPGCRSETTTFADENGKERSIDIVRC